MSDALLELTGEAETQEPIVTEPVEVEAVTPEPESEPEPAHEVATDPVKDEPRSIPLPTYLDERERRKEAERRLNEFEATRAERAQNDDMPDPYDDPRGFAEWQDRKTEQRLTAQRFELSDLMAKQQHGTETVEAAATWATERAKSDPSFAQAYMQQPHPIDWIVREHKRTELLNDIGDVSKLDDWFAREAEKRGFTKSAPNMTAQVVTQQPVARPVPPRSIASDAPAPATTADPDADFTAIFSRK
jgi:hypothetical protein